MKVERRELGFPALDEEAGVDALCLFIAEDERPLQGLSGYVDWRLCGALSRLILGGVFSGARGEQLLLPSEGRVAFSRIFAVGLGPSEGADPAGLSEALAGAGEMLSKARVQSVALEIPAQGMLEEAARAAVFTAKFLPAYRGERVRVLGERRLLEKVA